MSFLHLTSWIVGNNARIRKFTNRPEVRGNGQTLDQEPSVAHTTLEHGYGVTKAVWTPDSHFFVYSLESSGGHEAWHSPVWFYFRKEQEVLQPRPSSKRCSVKCAVPCLDTGSVTVELFSSEQMRTVALHQLRP